MDSGNSRSKRTRTTMETVPSQEAVLLEIRQVVEDIRIVSSSSFETIDRLSLKKSVHHLSELCKQDDYIDSIVKEEAIEAVVPLLAIGPCKSTRTNVVGVHEDIQRDVSFILGLLAVKPDYQLRITKCGAIPGLVKLLREHDLTMRTQNQPGSGGVARKAADAITNLAHENVDIKNLVRENEGIPPLVALLEAWDVKVQRAAAGALRTLAFKNEQNKTQIVDCGALPILIQLLRSSDSGVHYEAVGVIGNLVHSSVHIKRKVLEEGALQPVIALLGSNCPESQREAALLLGQFATTDADIKAKIAQRGAVPPLVTMLSSADITLKEMAAFALGRVAQNPDNQAGVVQCGALPPLLDLLESKHHNVQHNAAFALYGLAENEDNIAEMIQLGALHRLKDCCEKLSVQASRDCVQKTITRMSSKLGAQEEQKEMGRVLRQTVYMLRSVDQPAKQRIVTALAELLPSKYIPKIFFEELGLDVLIDMLKQPDSKVQREAAMAVMEMANKVNANITQCDAPPQPSRNVYLGLQYVNNPTLADVTFVVDGRPFFAHRIALLASSDAFEAMFSRGFREKEAGAQIEIPNIPHQVFEAMMSYIYTGDLEVKPELAVELLKAADQYLLDGLKRLCEMALSNTLAVDSAIPVFELAEKYSAPQLAKACALFVLKNYNEMVAEITPAGFAELMDRLTPVFKSLKQTAMELAERTC